MGSVGYPPPNSNYENVFQSNPLDSILVKIAEIIVQLENETELSNCHETQ